MSGTEQEMSVDFFEQVFHVPNDGVISWERSTEGMMKHEFGSPEGTRSYYMIRKVKDNTRWKQLTWLMERMFFILKTTYMSRDNYGLIAVAEIGTKVNWAFLLHNRFHSEVFGSDKRKQGGNKLAQMLSVIFEHAKENKLALKLSAVKSTPVVKATMTTKKERQPAAESDESDEPPSLRKRARTEEGAGGPQVSKVSFSDMVKLGFDQSKVQNALKENWTEISSKMEETPLTSNTVQESKEKGKPVLKISKKKLLFQKEKSVSSKFDKEEVKEVQLFSPGHGQTDFQSMF